MNFVFLFYLFCVRSDACAHFSSFSHSYLATELHWNRNGAKSFAPQATRLGSFERASPCVGRSFNNQKIIQLWWTKYTDQRLIIIKFVSVFFRCSSTRLTNGITLEIKRNLTCAKCACFVTKSRCPEYIYLFAYNVCGKCVHGPARETLCKINVFKWTSTASPGHFSDCTCEFVRPMHASRDSKCTRKRRPFVRSTIRCVRSGAVGRQIMPT